MQKLKAMAIKGMDAVFCSSVSEFVLVGGVSVYVVWVIGYCFTQVK